MCFTEFYHIFHRNVRIFPYDSTNLYLNKLSKKLGSDLKFVFLINLDALFPLHSVVRSSLSVHLVYSRMLTSLVHVLIVACYYGGRSSCECGAAPDVTTRCLAVCVTSLWHKVCLLIIIPSVARNSSRNTAIYYRSPSQQSFQQREKLVYRDNVVQLWLLHYCLLVMICNIRVTYFVYVSTKDFAPVTLVLF